MPVLQIAARPAVVRDRHSSGASPPPQALNRSGPVPGPEKREVVMTIAAARADLSVTKARQQKTWASGDYAVVASRIVLVSELLADAADLRAGWEVLDVACGNGNTTLAAARSGTYALGIDYVPELLEGGRARGGRGPRRRVPAGRHRKSARRRGVIRRGAERLRGDVRARSPAGRGRDHPGR